MFSGIVQRCVPVAEAIMEPGLLTFRIDLPEELQDGIEQGASIAIDGICMTVAAVSNGQVTFQAMDETLRLTTIGDLTRGRNVNVERSIRVGDEIGGHLVSGHISGTAEIIRVEQPMNNHVVTLRVLVAVHSILPSGRGAVAAGCVKA